MKLSRGKKNTEREKRCRINQIKSVKTYDMQRGKQASLKMKNAQAQVGLLE